MAASYRKVPVLELLLSSTSSNFFRSGYFLRTVTFSEMLVLSIINFTAFILEKLFINRRAFLQVYYELVWLSNSLTPLHKKWGFPLRISQETADLVTFTEEILNGKLQFFCAVLFIVESSKLISIQAVLQMWFFRKLVLIAVFSNKLCKIGLTNSIFWFKRFCNKRIVKSS